MAGATSPDALHLRRVGIDHLTLAGVSPPELITATAQAGGRHVGLHFETILNPLGLPDYSLIEDVALRRETRRRADDLGVSIALADGFIVQPDRSIETCRRSLEVSVELGCRRVNCVSLDTSFERSKDEFARLGEMAAEYGLIVHVEFFRRSVIANLAKALEVLEHARRPEMLLTIDTLHVVRSDDVAAFSRLDPRLIGYLQISDGPLHQPDDVAYAAESRENRGIPGEGELPLVAMLRRVPADVIVSGEVPQTNRRRAGESNAQITTSVVNGIYKVLDELTSGSEANPDHSRSAPT